MPTIVEVPGHGQVEFPDGMNDDQIAAAIKKNIPQASQPQLVVTPTDEQKSQSSAGMRFAQGLKDPIDAGAQLLTKMLPDSVVQAGNKANNWLADKTGLVGKLPEGGVDQSIRESESKYQAARAATGNEGVDWMRLGGNVASPANLAIASKIPVGVTGVQRLAAGLGGGSLMGVASAPVTEGDFATEKAKQAGLGALGGTIGNAVTGTAARVISPKVREQIAKLLSEGVTPTPGQIMGGRWQAAEDKLTSIPILGDAIASSRKKGLDELNTAAYKRALAHIGAKPTPGAGVGRDGVADVHKQISDSYNNLLPKLTFRADQQFSSELQNLQQMASSLPPEMAKRFEKIVRDKVVGKLGPRGTMDGEALKGIESELGELASGLKRDALFDNRQLGDAIYSLQDSIRQTLVRSNPQQAGELKNINKAFANYARIRDAAGRIGADEGEFTAPQLQSAVRNQDRSKGKTAFSEGKALMQDLSDPAKSVLPSKYPDSGSIGRLLMGATAAGGGAMLAPKLLAGAGVASLPYLPGGRQLAAALMAKRPAGAKQVSDSVRKLAPYLNAGAIPLLDQ